VKSCILMRMVKMADVLCEKWEGVVAWWKRPMDWVLVDMQLLFLLL
jgi:hypothetical protein